MEPISGGEVKILYHVGQPKQDKGVASSFKRTLSSTNWSTAKKGPEKGRGN